MKELLRKFSSFTNSLRSFSSWFQRTEHTLLFDSSTAASDIAFMLGGEWDGCNGVFLPTCDEAAVNTATDLVGAKWCYGGASLALLLRLNADELLRRYATGERNFVNADLRQVILLKRVLSEANLSYAKLSGADLSCANLSGADLTAADLSEVNLSKANLSKASLIRTNMCKANLWQVDLRGGNLSRACLNGANLNEVDLRGANLSLADLRGASLRDANFSEANLRGAKLTLGDLREANLTDAIIGD